MYISTGQGKHSLSQRPGMTWICERQEVFGAIYVLYVYYSRAGEIISWTSPHRPKSYSRHTKPFQGKFQKDLRKRPLHLSYADLTPNTSQYLTIPANSLTSVRKVNSLDGLLSVYADRAQLPETNKMPTLTKTMDFKWLSI
jgi:hypothetical protein